MISISSPPCGNIGFDFVQMCKMGYIKFYIAVIQQVNTVQNFVQNCFFSTVDVQNLFLYRLVQNEQKCTNLVRA